MNIKNILSAGFWFRYIGSSVQNFDNSESKYALKGRAVYALFQDSKNQFWLIPQELDTKYKITKAQAELLVTSSKPYSGKINGTSINPGAKTFAQTFNRDPEPEPIFAPEPELVVPKIAGATTISLEMITQPVTSKLGVLHPPSESIEELITSSLSLVGSKVKFKRGVKMAVSTSMSTCLLTRKNPLRGRYDIYIVLNVRQLNQLFGRITPKVLAQVITHELGHYIISHVVRQSDVMKFKKLIAAKKLHKDQFNHPGYSYPWWDEAWAILCEAMVHGSSARGFSTPLGWEIAEKYFVNRYIKNGQYTGSTDSI